MSATAGLETSLIVSISQICEGDAKCHCGEPAVLIVDSEPDNEPGPTCYVHAMDWVNMALGITERIFGPKVRIVVGKGGLTP